MSNLLRVLRETYSARRVVHHLVRQQLMLRYRRTMLGYLWTLLNPLLMMTITAIVFANLFKMDFKTYVVFMFAGMVAWNCFSGIVSQSSSAFFTHEGLIKKIYLPKLIFPLCISLGVVIDSILSLGALFIIIFSIGGEPSWALLFLPVSYLLLFLFSFGAALFISMTTLFLRDMQHVITIALQALFFLTPVLYEQSAVSPKLAVVLALNPMTYFVELFRAPIRYGAVPDIRTLTICLLLVVLSLGAGFAFFLAKEKKIVFRL